MLYVLYSINLSSPKEAFITPCAKNGSALATGGSLFGLFAKWCVQVLAQQNLFNFRVRYCERGRVFGHVVANIVTCHGIPWASGCSLLFVGTSKEPAISFSIEHLTQCPPVSRSLLSTLPGRHPTLLEPHHIPAT